ncbi:MAG: photosynthetic complex putative assembly protein PuhB [Gammaproteobacteria bacterium]
MSDEHEFEPVHGLPEFLPAGERILWQGEPDARALARDVFFRRALAIYFTLVIAWQAFDAWSVGLDAGSVGAAVAGTVVLALVALGLVTLFARLYARTTVYTITNRRIVLRFGLALPLNVNLPFNVIEAAAVRVTARGCGDIALSLAAGERVGYVHMWPCVARWHFTRPRPALRGVADVATVAGVLAAALEHSAAPTVSDAAAATLGARAVAA